ncbi:MAG TPA: sigma-70 family RNA polymerase sigma factor [Pyrinomonadaceae bacterium]|nr:sigma-70 family RNA polymerase sigma factor [Pyrinomonadaceae bacterium]
MLKTKLQYQTDVELIQACRAGDEAAWEELVFKYQKLLFSIPRRAGLNPEQAADVLQDVFTTLFEKLDSLEKPEFLRAWLLTTTRHKTIHFIQRELKRKPKSIDESEENDQVFQIPDGMPLADEILIRFEKQKQIEEAFSKLEEPCQRLLTMLFLEKNERSYAEISEELGIPLGSIGPTRARCLQKLLKFMPE